MLLGGVVRLGNCTFDKEINCFALKPSRCGQFLQSAPTSQHLRGGSEWEEVLKKTKKQPLHLSIGSWLSCHSVSVVKQTVATILFVAFSRFTCFQHFEAQLKVKIYDFLVLPRSAFVEVCGGSVHHIQTWYVSASEQLKITSSLPCFWFYYQKVLTVQSDSSGALVPTPAQHFLQPRLPIFSNILPIW